MSVLGEASAANSSNYKDETRVAAGLKATLKNPRVSDEAKQSASERLERLGKGQGTTDMPPAQGDDDIIDSNGPVAADSVPMSKRPGLEDDETYLPDVVQDQESTSAGKRGYGDYNLRDNETTDQARESAKKQMNLDDDI